MSETDNTPNSSDEVAEVLDTVVRDVGPTIRDQMISEGHALIDRHLAQAKRLADLHPAIKSLLPVISGCLHDLFQHMTAETAPQAAAPASAPSKPPPASAGTES